jgi:hypothetical protein
MAKVGDCAFNNFNVGEKGKVKKWEFFLGKRVINIGKICR